MMQSKRISKLFIPKLAATIVGTLLMVTNLNAAPVLKPSPPQVDASSYLLMDAKSGNIITELNADQALPPASLTKMMTSYLVTHELSTGKIQENDLVNVSVAAWKMKGSRMFIKEGTQVKLIDLLRGVIIQSGNDASIALAEHLAGSEQAFVSLMNQYAEHFGMSNTQFQNATGWPAEGHLSTARDLALLAQHVIYDHPEYYKIYSEKTFTYNNIKQANRNQLLMRDPAVDGLKTGHTEEAGYCLVSSAEKDDMRLIAVVMGTKSSKSRTQESLKLLNYGFRFYSSHSLYAANEPLETVRVWKGKLSKLALGLADSLQVTIPKGQQDALTGEFVVDTNIEAPIPVGTQLGTLKVKLNDEVIEEKPLVALTSVEEAGFFSRLWDSIILFFMTLFA
jgi:D-alanyl-D-alanine carboxypeptidase (penicillin-binding protein 5/6)